MRRCHIVERVRLIERATMTDAVLAYRDTTRWINRIAGIKTGKDMDPPFGRTRSKKMAHEPKSPTRSPNSERRSDYGELSSDYMGGIRFLLTGFLLPEPMAVWI